MQLDFGIQFFPAVGPDEKPADVYFDECLRLVELCDEYGYTNVRTVEHYFHPYGGYSPNPLVLLAAASQRSKKARMVTGAVLPVFNNPLKLAGEIGMLDAICGGRLELGVARAFLPHEFAHFKVPLDESVARYDEGVEQLRLLLSQENVSHPGKFHSFKNVTSYPRPTQKPHPPMWTAAFNTASSFEKAGRQGNSIMCIPIAGSKMRELLDIYRTAWKQAGHPGKGRVMLAHHMFCAETEAEAIRLSKKPLERYLKVLVEAASDWLKGAASADYPDYERLIRLLESETFEHQVESGSAWIGTPDQLIRQIEEFVGLTGGYEIASLQVNFTTISYADAARSMRLFGSEVMPRFAAKRAAAE